MAIRRKPVVWVLLFAGLFAGYSAELNCDCDDIRDNFPLNDPMSSTVAGDPVAGRILGQAVDWPLTIHIESL